MAKLKPVLLTDSKEDQEFAKAARQRQRLQIKEQKRLAKRKRRQDARGIMWYRYRLQLRTRLLKWMKK